MNVRDVVAAFALALETEKQFGSVIFNVGTTRAVSLIELVDIINRAMGIDLTPELIANPIKSGYIAEQQADLTNIHRELGYVPIVTLEEGIAEIVAHRKTHPVMPSSLSF